MTIQVDLPGGHTAVLRDVDDLTGADQDAFLDLYDQLMAAKPQPEARPDPANPAVMLEPPPRRLTTADNRVLRDWILGQIILSWTLDAPLPYTSGTRGQLPVQVCNALVRASQPMQDALAGVDEDTPKPEKTSSPGGGGSTSTSRDESGSPLPVPPAVPSSTPAG